MRNVFSAEGLSVLESLAFTRTLYAFDFDGTISPIVSSPDRAKLPQPTAELLRKVAKRAPVAVISGRALSDLREKVGKIAPTLVGSHGLESPFARADALTRSCRIARAWRTQLAKIWGRLRADTGVFLEDKEYSLALHYRRSRNKKTARAELLERIERLDPRPRIIPGKCVISLVPQGAPHKGAALLELLDRANLRCALYVGDDDTDEDVFSLPDPRVITVRIGRKRASQAQYFMDRQGEINALLRRILRTRGLQTGAGRWPQGRDEASP